MIPYMEILNVDIFVRSRFTLAPEKQAFLGSQLYKFTRSTVCHVHTSSVCLTWLNLLGTPTILRIPLTTPASTTSVSHCSQEEVALVILVFYVQGEGEGL